MQELMQFCNTDRQREILQAVIDNGGQRAAARAKDTPKSNIDRIMKSMLRKVDGFLAVTQRLLPTARSTAKYHV